MVDFGQSNTYTGKNEPPQPRQRSVKGPSFQNEQLADQRARDRATIYQRNYDNAVKATDLKIDDLDIAKLGAKDHLGTLMSDYNKTRAEILPRSKNGSMAPEDTALLKQKELEIYAEYKNALDSQKNYTSVMSQAGQHANTGDVDMDKLRPAVEAYVKNGEPFTLTTVPLKPIDVNLAITDTSKKVSGDRTPEENITITNPDGTVRRGTARINPSETQKINDIIDSSILSNDRVVDDVTRKWEKWFKSASEEDKKKYLFEEDQQPGFSQQETNNAILRWMHDDPQARANAIGFMDYPPSKVTTKPPKEEVPAKKRSVPINYGGTVRNNLYSFGGVAVKDVPTADGTILHDNRTTPITKGTTPGGGNISGDLLDYDKDSDKVIIRSSTGVPSLRIDPKTLIEVPADNIPGINDKKVMYDGKLTTIGEIRRNSSTTAPKKKLY